MRKILSIAGFDPSGGAGVILDCLVALEHGFFCYAAVTTVTAQNSQEVRDFRYVPLKVFKDELDVLFEEGGIEGVKLGLLGKAEIAKRVARFIKKSRLQPVVCDPVLLSSSGQLLSQKKIISVYREDIFPISIPTFNAIEAERFFGFSDDLGELFSCISEVSSSFVVKGGHLKGSATDFVFHQGEVRSFTLPRLKKEVRGTGCAFSTSFLCNLLMRKDVFEAVKEAKYYVYEKIKKSKRIGKGRFQMVFEGVKA